jgi:hypothetical protein
MEFLTNLPIRTLKLYFQEIDHTNLISGRLLKKFV